MSDTASWQPSAPIANLLKRAAIMAEIRRFFADRGVLEVETPTMSQATVTDIHLVPFETRFVGPGAADGLTLYMMTSPEYHMKRLLAAGSGPIYQLGRSFRNEEAGRYHNPEFTMLEWYRPHYDMYRLMNEVDDLLQQILDCNSAETLSYQQAFLRHLNIDPLSAEKAQLREVAAKLDLSNIADTEEDLTDGDEQLQRFEQDNRNRAKRGLPQNPIDMNLIAALKQGLPDCSGVALGVDRLVMLALNAERLSDVIAFPVNIA